VLTFQRLKLSGFKSFVDQSELYIEPGVTAVVGPNGCGKSNLVEALRWVMGESSAKRMRGGEMDDVIFAGTQNRASRNLAEVTLHLDNRARQASAAFNDFDELQVSRRIERGNGSTYRVNGKEARARDVQLLFADAASGAQSVALVSQGRVGALVNAKPADRRSLLEEAAGISGLHSRRHEAELRLKAAESNLERLEDVLRTLGQQMAGLKKQARQASRYRNLAEHIRKHEALLLHEELTQAKEAAVARRQELELCQRAVATETEAVSKSTREEAAASEALPDLRQAEASAAAGLQKVSVERETLEKERRQVNEALAAAAQRIRQIEADRERAAQQCADAERAQAALSEERERLSESLPSREEAIAAADGQLAELTERVATLERDLQRLTEEQAGQEARAKALDSRLNELNQRQKRLQQEAEQANRQEEQLRQERAAHGSLEDAEAAVTRSEAALRDSQQALEGLEQRSQQARTARDEAAQAHAERERQLERLSGEAAGLAAVLLPAGQSDWLPVVDRVAVSEGFEAALGAAFGEDLDAPCDPAAAVRWTELEALPPQDLPAGAVALAEKVTAPKALARRLAQVGIVESADAAARLQSTLKPGQRLVTPAGDLFRWDGFTAMADAPTAAAQRLAQKNRLQALEAELERVRPYVASAAEARAAAAKAVEQAESEERQARQAAKDAQTAAAQARKRRDQLAQLLSAGEKRLAALTEARTQRAARLEECAEALTAATRERAALPDLSAGRTAVATARAELAEARAAQNEQRAQLDGMKRDRDAAHARLAAIGREAASWQERAESAAQHSEELSARQQELSAEQRALAARPAAIEAEQARLAEVVSEAETARRQTADRLALAETAQREARQALKAAEGRLAEARERRARLETAAEAARDKLLTLRAKIEDAMGCRPEAVLQVAEVDLDKEWPKGQALAEKLQKLIREREAMGPVNLRADIELEELDEEMTRLTTERDDLLAAIQRLRQGIASLNREAREKLTAAFTRVDQRFSILFQRLFGGGRAHLSLTGSDDPLEAGLEIMASPPGKKLQVLSLLSGGEQALTALALIFAVFQTNPAPICVLDEVDAPLDDANVDRFCTLVDQMAAETETRFLVITHHRLTMARADRLYGVTMAEQGISQLVSVDLKEAEALRETA